MIKYFILFSWPGLVFFVLGYGGWDIEALGVGALAAVGAVADDNFRLNTIKLVALQTISAGGGWFLGYKFYAIKNLK